ncbi:MAG: hypothetical protein FWG44_02800 [Oscillospiraceae bacterium]|nr:hypothetical protein [Oscillospiraceae bacterium]
MRKLKKTLFTIFVLLLAAVFVTAIPASALATNYSYIYGFWGEEIPTPDAYYVSAYLTGNDFELDGEPIGNFRDPQGLYVRDNRIYVCDTRNDRIVLIEYDEKTDDYHLVRVEYSVMINGAPSEFKAPEDLFEDRNGDVYIADTGNQRILHLDHDFNVINIIVKPDESSLEIDLEFLPQKLVVDFSGRVFTQVKNVNKGLMEFDEKGEFTSFMGAGRVHLSIADIFWRMISSDEQLKRQELIVPTEFNNVAIDHEGFLYTTLSTFQPHEVEYVHPVRRLNSVGTDILVRNGYWVPVGDWFYSFDNNLPYNGVSKFVDVVVFPNDSYACLDRTKGRVFLYDFQGNQLAIFGNPGNQQGFFQNPSAIDRMGNDILVLDAQSAAVTHFKQTDYGFYISEAMNFYFNGLYNESAEMWDEVLKLNGSYDLAYIGKGRAALRNEQYYEAMQYYEAKYDDENYGKAFALYRKEWIEKHIQEIIIIIAGLYVALKVLKYVIKKTRKGREEA